jgi:cell division septum initiation protein DivIVA
MSYTKKEVTNIIIKDRVKLLEKIERLETEVSRLENSLQTAEQRYADIASRCIQMYVKDGTIKPDSIVVRVDVPAFLSQDDLSVAIMEHIKDAILRERAEKSFERGEPLLK